MKKSLLIVAVLMLTTTFAFANEGKLKLGVVFGTDEAVTLGIRTSEKMEINVMAGLGFGNYLNTDGEFFFDHVYQFVVGANVLFTIADINIGGNSFPLSVGPAVNVAIGSGYKGTGSSASVFGYSFFTDYEDAVGVRAEVLGLVRWEHTFAKAPVNVFVEAGAGVSLGSGGFGFGYQSNVGARYVF